LLVCLFSRTTNLQSDNRVATTQSRKTLPHVVCCRIWRFPDLQNCNELKSNCQNGYNHNQSNAIKRNDDASLICINPYHYVRCTETGSSIQQQQQQSQLTVYVPKQQILNTNINNNNNRSEFNHEYCTLYFNIYKSGYHATVYCYKYVFYFFALVLLSWICCFNYNIFSFEKKNITTL